MMQASITPSVCYHDARAALAWLCEAFGFVPTVVIEGPDGDPAQSHYEVAVAEGSGARMAVSGVWADWTRSPQDLAANTQWLAVHLPDEIGAAGLDAHCARARAAGAQITAEPVDEFFGDRRYRAVDPEGHRWSFSVHVRDVDKAEAEEFLGQAIEKWA